MDIRYGAASVNAAEASAWTPERFNAARLGIAVVKQW